MSNVNFAIDLFVLSDEELYSEAKKIITAFADTTDTKLAVFSLKDVTKAMANFQSASANVKEEDESSLFIRNLAREALTSVLNAVTGKEAIN